VHFSIGGHQFFGEPVFFSYMPDLVMEHARNVTVKLHNRVGRYVRLQLYFAAKWIMVSEVSFDSGEFKCTNNNVTLRYECMKVKLYHV
jgi:discoidin domain receptor family protein 2